MKFKKKKQKSISALAQKLWLFFGDDIIGRILRFKKYNLSAQDTRHTTCDLRHATRNKRHATSDMRQDTRRRHTHRTHAQDMCTRHVYKTHAQDTCTKHMHKTHAQDTCTRYTYKNKSSFLPGHYFELVYIYFVTNERNSTKFQHQGRSGHKPMRCLR